LTPGLVAGNGNGRRLDLPHRTDLPCGAEFSPFAAGENGNPVLAPPIQPKSAIQGGRRDA